MLRLLTLASCLVSFAAAQPPPADLDCARWGMGKRLDTPKLLYDFFLLSYEQDLLRIRFEELYPVVDHFFLFEANHTFTDKPKPMAWPLLKDRPHFAKFKDKITHISVHKLEGHGNWEREKWARNNLVTRGFQTIQPKEGDLYMLSDLDEITRRPLAEALKWCEQPWGESADLQHDFFYYNYQTLSDSEIWAKAKVAKYPHYHNRAEELRMSNGHRINKAGWHCSWCFPTVERIQHKLGSFAHSEFDNDHMRSANRIIDVVRNGKDLFERQANTWSRIPDERLDLPWLLRVEKPPEMAYLWNVSAWPRAHHYNL